MNFEELRDFLNEKSDQYNNYDFIEDDPIQIPHRFSLKQDIEIAGFLAATISWGNRKSIIRSAEKMLDIMGNSPYDFVMNFSEKDLDSIRDKSIHRTFNGEDFTYFIQQFNKVYRENESLENLFLIKDSEFNFLHAIERFRTSFLETSKHRSHKHVSSPYKNSSSKRIIMFLRWMVRKDKRSVDFGIWENIDPKYLSIPLDVHTGNISRKLSLITRTQNDWKTVEELDQVIRQFDDKDPAKYDFALFGLGVSKEFL
ncbi:MULTISPECIES: TIGR02757 family protein [Chryseobacterium]|uniref:TIGR02757 family protein n=1 Tax=Chryseobacterium TaxID=59732 RepID=UPI00235A0F6F|nr:MULTISPECIES: TIGR02757 family protein [unclassified Chryseobacterium]MDC8103124.1 TIGR02757 family protein [Chryseobacterium sp. B21-037]MDQ1802669.1 TIGR02757 family protein [Chryseobacterium sp. CKR4-1]WBV56684.1 TIGR02757 family protein [Chryseobacterium daecheongense]